MKPSRLIGRRQFLQTSAGTLAAATAAPTILPTSALGQNTEKKVPPSERLVVGCIGVGDLGRRHHLAGCILPNPHLEVAAVCDVDRNHRDEAAQMVKDRTGRRVRVYEDFRRVLEHKDIDAVFIVTPDHWHAIISIAAMEAGKDVYCEKPLTLTIEEGKQMVKTARRHGTVFQTGSMQRSDPRFRRACELIRNGKIGKITKIMSQINGVPAGQWQPFQTPPPELNWDLWLGPTPYTEYAPNRCHYNFRWHYTWSGGRLTDWGAHHNDIAQWGLGTDHTGPVKVIGKGQSAPDGPYNVAQNFEVTYTYENGTQLICTSEGENGVKFFGTDGWLFVNRERIEASNPEILKSTFGPNDVRLYNTGDDPNIWGNHYGNWIECIRTRKRPICDVEISHRSATVCHLGNIAIQLGRELNWDPAKEEFVNDPEAQSLVSRPMRAPWTL